MVLDILDGIVVAVRAVTNPDKLERLGAIRSCRRIQRTPARALGRRGLELPATDLARRRPGQVVDDHEFLRGRPRRHASATISRSSSSVGASSVGTTQATTRSPHSGSGRFQTATSATPGCVEARSTWSATLLRARDDDIGHAAGDRQPAGGAEPARLAGGEPARSRRAFDSPVGPSR